MEEQIGRNRCVMQTASGRCAGGNLPPGESWCNNLIPCEKSMTKYTNAREEALKFLMLHGCNQAAADTLLDAIEDGDCQWLSYTETSNIGMKASNRHYTIQQIRETCRMLQDRLNLSFMDISKHTGVDYSSVKNLYYKKTWRHITKHFDFTARLEKNRKTYNNSLRNFLGTHCKELSP